MLRITVSFHNLGHGGKNRAHTQPGRAVTEMRAGVVILSTYLTVSHDLTTVGVGVCRTGAVFT